MTKNKKLILNSKKHNIGENKSKQKKYTKDNVDFTNGSSNRFRGKADTNFDDFDDFDDFIPFNAPLGSIAKTMNDMQKGKTKSADIKQHDKQLDKRHKKQHNKLHDKRPTKPKSFPNNAPSRENATKYESTPSANKHENITRFHFPTRKVQRKKNASSSETNELLVRYSLDTYKLLKESLSFSITPIFTLQPQLKSHMDLLSVFNTNSRLPSYRHIVMYRDAVRIDSVLKKWYKSSLCRSTYIQLRHLLPIDSSVKKIAVEVENTMKESLKTDKANSEDGEESQWKPSVPNVQELVDWFTFEDKDLVQLGRINEMSQPSRIRFFEKLFKCSVDDAYPLSQYYNISFQSMNGIRFADRSVELKIKEQLLNLLHETRLICLLFSLLEESQLRVYSQLYLREGSVKRIKSVYLLLGTYAKIYTCLKSYLLLINDVYYNLRQGVELLPSSETDNDGIISYQEICCGNCILPDSLEDYCGKVLDIVKANNYNKKYRDLPRVEDFLQGRLIERNR